ncbi:MAG: hypothetical protein WCI75_19385, partial [candidate division NC10 bacterium]
MTNKSFFSILAALCLSALGGSLCAAADAPADAQMSPPILGHDPVQVTRDLIDRIKKRPPEPAPTPEQKKIDERLVSIEAKIDAAKTPGEQKAIIRQEAEGIAEVLISAEIQAAPKEYRHQIGNDVANILN